MIKLNPFRQSAGLCGPASLKILMEYYGRDFSEEELTNICKASADYGTDHAQMVDAIKSIGENPLAKDNAALEDIREQIAKHTPVVVGWWSQDEDHYSVVYNIDEKFIYLMDPEIEDGKRIMPIDEFLKIWHDFDGPENTRVEHWMMAIESAR
ncbi:C39 family peptidase [Patescibacteria group bacterium]|nr:C39 family peptidase [Patescibacteria group bacterium]MBU1907900.1 C39 family peptidase [Patescibacteria group bacterium]